MACEQLLCSICLDMYNDPVSTPCGHNFCKICLNTHWNNSQHYRCPNCNKTFKQRPDLKINTTLRDVVDEYKKKIEIFCDICTEGKLKAVKSCLVCQSSYCETHLESHLRVSGLRKHKLIDPVKNLQDYICPKHERPLELFCRDDQTCVCLSCTDGDHKNHNTVPMRESELLEMMEKKQKASVRHDEDVIKDLEQEITELKRRNFELEMKAEKQRASETQDKDLIRNLKKEITDLKKEIIELKKRNIDLEMKIEMQKSSVKKYEEVIKHLNQEISELKKRKIELKEMMEEKQRAKEKQSEDVIKDLIEESTELKRRNIDLEKITENQRASETQDKNLIRGLKKEITQLKERDAELVIVKQKQLTAENVIKFREQEITGLKRRNFQLNIRATELMKQKQITAENVIKVREQEITNLKKEITELNIRTTELVMVKQKQITAENVIKVREQEITDLKRRNTEQQQKISNTENNLRLLQEKHQEDLSHLQKSSSGGSCMLWVLSVFVGVFLVLCANEHKNIHWLKWMQQYAVDVTLDPDTAHPNLILSDDKKQVRYEDTEHNLPNNPIRFDRYFNVLGKEGFSSGRFYFEVDVTGKTSWTIGVARESVNRKGDFRLAPVNRYWTVNMRNKNKYVAHAGPDVFLCLRVNPQKVGVFVDYEAGEVSFYDAESGSHIYSFTGQHFSGKLFPVLNPCINRKGINSKPLIIISVRHDTW